MSTPEEPPESESPYAAHPVPYRAPAPTPTPASEVVAPAAVRPPKVLWVVPAVVVLLVVVGVVTAIIAASSDGDGVFADSQQADVLSATGYDDLVSAVADEGGSTSVFDAVLYPECAVVSIPADGTTQRQESFYWDGSELSSNDNKSTSSSDRFDLTGVKGQVLVDLVARARQLVEDPTTWYVIVRAPDDNGSMVSAYATNEYGETAYLSASSDGTVTYNSTEH